MGGTSHCGFIARKANDTHTKEERNVKHHRLTLLLLALAMCLGLTVTAYGYVDLARDATLIAPQFHDVYRPALANDGVGPADPYY